MAETSREEVVVVSISELEDRGAFDVVVINVSVDVSLMISDELLSEVVVVYPPSVLVETESNILPRTLVRVLVTIVSDVELLNSVGAMILEPLEIIPLPVVVAIVVLVASFAVVINVSTEVELVSSVLVVVSVGMEEDVTSSVVGIDSVATEEELPAVVLVETLVDELSLDSGEVDIAIASDVDIVDVFVGDSVEEVEKIY